MSANKKDVALEAIKRRILTLEVAPGVALDEISLSSEFGLSRTPLRELFQRLAGEGYLSLENNRGATASDMDLSTMRSFFQCAPLVYAAVARLAAEQATTAQISLLKKTQTKFHRAVKNNVVVDMVIHNHRFHDLTGEMAASVYLTPSLRRLLIDHTRMSHRFYTTLQKTSQKRVLEASRQHDEMIAAFETRNAATAVELTLAHWELSRSDIEKYVNPTPLPMDVNTHVKSSVKRKKVKVSS